MDDDFYRFNQRAYQEADDPIESSDSDVGFGSGDEDITEETTDLPSSKTKQKRKRRNKMPPRKKKLRIDLSPTTEKPSAQKKAKTRLARKEMNRKNRINNLLKKSEAIATPSGRESEKDDLSFLENDRECMEARLRISRFRGGSRWDDSSEEEEEGRPSLSSPAKKSSRKSEPSQPFSSDLRFLDEEVDDAMLFAPLPSQQRKKEAVSKTNLARSHSTSSSSSILSDILDPSTKERLDLFVSGRPDSLGSPSLSRRSSSVGSMDQGPVTLLETRVLGTETKNIFCVPMNASFETLFNMFSRHYKLPEDTDMEKDLVFVMDGEAVSKEAMPGDFDLEENESCVVDVRVKKESLMEFFDKKEE